MMNRRKFLQLGTTGPLLMAGFPVITPVFANSPDKETMLLVSEELILPLKANWPATSAPCEWLEIKSDPILQFADVDHKLLVQNVILGVSTWMDYIIMSGLFREQGLRIKMVREQHMTDQRGNSLKAYHWVVA